MSSLKLQLALPTELRPAAEAIAASLSDSVRTSGQRLYATIDLAAVEDADAWLKLLRQANGHNLFVGHPEGKAESLAAWMVSVADAAAIDDRVLGFSIAQAMLADSVTWLLNPLPPDDMVRRLSSRLTASLPEGQALFRYYDPRLLPVIYEEWPPDASGRDFFALGSAWHHLDASFRLQSLRLPEPGQSDVFVSPMSVTEAQQERLQSVSETYQLIRFLGLRKPQEFFGLDAERRLAFVTEQSSRAMACGVVRFRDRLRYCELALELGEDFGEEERWEAVWEEMRSTDATLADAMSRVDMGEDA